ncbi:hypothetical protein [Chryseobacterium sp. JK1]|uniref:hypothetical protein n=1 Tax=Chryseobacterium sp. JK1 TaxID=874294 RepID=UPI003D6941EE
MFSKIPLILLLMWATTLYSQNQKKNNRIDSLQTTEEIQKFIDEKELDYTITINEKIQYDSYCSAIADSLNIKPWGKGDFDNNGLTDLLITGNSKEGVKTICILDQGDHFEKVNISLGNLYEACAFATARDNKVVYHKIKF